MPKHMPRRWLVSDERNHERLETSLRHLPRGSGMIFRHFHLPPPQRKALFARLQRMARPRQIMVALAGDALTARRWKADAVFSPPTQEWQHKTLQQARLAHVHTIHDLAWAKRRRADAVVISPVFPTRSHPGSPTLGRLRFVIMGRLARLPVIALGGMTERRARLLRGHGWAAIDGLTYPPLVDYAKRRAEA